MICTYLESKHVQCVVVKHNLAFWETILQNCKFKNKKKIPKQYLTESCETVLNSVLVFILYIYAYHSLPSIFLSEFWRLTQSDVKFNPEGVARQAKWWHLLWMLSPHSNIFLSLLQSFISIVLALLGVAFSGYSCIIFTLGLIQGPFCNSSGGWDYIFKDTTGG